MPKQNKTWPYAQELNFSKLQKFFPQLSENIKKLSTLQQHSYKNPDLAVIALTHRSALVYWPQDKSGIFSNERLEFLGDAFLNFFIAQETMLQHITLQEGELSRLRAACVGTTNLAAKSFSMGLGDCLLVGNTELKNAVTATIFSPDNNRTNNILADAFEAVTAALLLDAGEAITRKWLKKVFTSELSLQQSNLVTYDAKSKLQQWVQSILGIHPVYKVIDTATDSNNTLFTLAAFIGTQEVGKAQAANKTTASKIIAQQLLQKIENGELTKEMVTKYVK